MVSIIVPTYKRKLDMIRKSIQSAIAQEETEVIVVDDNPLINDFSADIKNYCENLPNVRYIRQFGNHGVCAARNLGVANARGTVIGFVDDDDELLPGFVSTLLPHLQGGVKLVSCCGWMVKKDGVRNAYPSFYSDSPITFDSLLTEDTMQSIVFLVDRKTFIDVGGFDESMRSLVDYEIRLAVAKDNAVKLLPNKLFLYNLHDDTHITTNDSLVIEGLKFLYRKYRPYYRKNAKAYASLWFFIWKRQRNLGQRFRAFISLTRSITHRPKYLGRAILIMTRSEKLRSYLNSKRTHRSNSY